MGDLLTVSGLGSLHCNVLDSLVSYLNSMVWMLAYSQDRGTRMNGLNRIISALKQLSEFDGSYLRTLPLALRTRFRLMNYGIYSRCF